MSKLRCKFVNKDTFERCNKWSMNNGFCNIHGGVNTIVSNRANGRIISRSSNIAKQIEEAKGRLRLFGNTTFAARLKHLEQNSNYMNIKNDALTVAGMIDHIIEELGTMSLPDEEKLKYFTMLESLVSTSVAIKEKAFKIRVGYFDIDGMKLIFQQIVTNLRFLRSQFQSYPDNMIPKDEVIKRLDEIVMNIHMVKVPMIKDGAEA